MLKLLMKLNKKLRDWEKYKVTIWMKNFQNLKSKF